MKALELVAYFHRQLGRLEHTRFEDHETAYADELLAIHSEAEIRDLIDYAIAKAGETKFPMLFFGALKRYVAEWSAGEARRKEQERRVCDGLAALAEMAAELPKLRAVPGDPKDDMVVATAVATTAEYLVTGDRKHLLSLGTYEGIQIVTPRDFLELLGK